MDGNYPRRCHSGAALSTNISKFDPLSALHNIISDQYRYDEAILRQQPDRLLEARHVQRASNHVFKRMAAIRKDLYTLWQRSEENQSSARQLVVSLARELALPGRYAFQMLSKGPFEETKLLLAQHLDRINNEQQLIPNALHARDTLHLQMRFIEFLFVCDYDSINSLWIEVASNQREIDMKLHEHACLELELLSLLVVLFWLHTHTVRRQPVENPPAEFKGRIRPPCTTMPWTIRTALAVLWGVCWMFYYPRDIDTSSTGREPEAALVTPSWDISEPLQPSGGVDEWWNHAMPTWDGTVPFDQFDFNVDSEPDVTFTFPKDCPVGASSETYTAQLGGHPSLTDSHGWPPAGPCGGTQTGVVHQIPSSVRAGDRDGSSGVSPETSPAKEVLSCPQCPERVFARKSTLRRHLEKQHSTSTLLCPRPGCGKAFKRKDNLNRHVRQGCRRSSPVAVGRPASQRQPATRRKPARKTSAVSPGMIAAAAATGRGPSSTTGRDPDARPSLVEQLRLERQSRSAALEIQERDCQKSREALASLDETIRILEEEDRRNQSE